ncbi:hypothetical protein C8Q70DRAFT_1056108 [Cubamyces menziesii]|uniref:Uncharacterized protein n=1 Tax=Trametes cubensis TaxID=1111947 RepID=A0AAD7TMH9_9APHY|nr:hypothetical protein C8Q70DRAFT_1056108 [Cubamyces menziesii]KAJ8463487.1 hypothetical protein ONZ51_g10222 [Trametes cubensis]
MKFFSGILPIAGVALTLFLGATAQKATDVIRSIDFVASSAHNLDEDIQRVNDGNVADEGQLIGQGISAFKGIIQDQLESVFDNVDNSMPFNDDDAQLVLDAFQQSVTTEKATLQTIIDKRDFAEKYLLVDEIVQPVRDLRAALVTYSGAVIALIPSQASGAYAAFNDLSDILEAAVQAYES